MGAGFVGCKIHLETFIFLLSLLFANLGNLFSKYYIWELMNQEIIKEWFM